jgi:UDP-N-acetylmuramoyl-L-alanyl-D-glutamate--2,6-diaminopimelate ligase
MRLRELVQRCEWIQYRGTENPDIRGVSTDSRKVGEGHLFIAIRGYREDGNRYIDDALRRGARAVVVEEGLCDEMQAKVRVPVCSSQSPRHAALLISRILFGFPAGSLTLIGVTGTNGKTTITYLLERMLQEGGRNPGVIGTVSYRWNTEELKAHNTTPDPIEIQELLATMSAAGVSHVIMEVSSHALAMERVYPPDFHHAVFTNLSQDHLDFHESMEDYFAAKARLFEGLSEDRSAIINLDDEYGRRLLRRTAASKMTYGMGEGADFRGHHADFSIRGTSFHINDRQYRTSLVGAHNVYNILAAVACASSLGIEYEETLRALEEVKRVPGRFERAVEGLPFHVFVDYAHTPDALNHLLDAANGLKTGRIITVFGCGGDRDRGKRPKMAAIVEEKSDLAIVTSDNPRSEDPLAIIEEIKRGLRRDDHLVIPDRREAIYRAVELARKGDMILIAGKGHEDYQVLGERIVHFDDREVAAQAVRDLKK